MFVIWEVTEQKVLIKCRVYCLHLVLWRWLTELTFLSKQLIWLQSQERKIVVACHKYVIWCASVYTKLFPNFLLTFASSQFCVKCFIWTRTLFFIIEWLCHKLITNRYENLVLYEDVLLTYAAIILVNSRITIQSESSCMPRSGLQIPILIVYRT